MTSRPCVWAVVLAAAFASGCCSKPPPPPVAPYPYPRSLIVVPLMNHSPAEVDTLAATDVLVRELSDWKGLTVLPTNRPLKLLAAQNRTHVRSVQEALQIAQALGVDGVVVGAVTEYEPYKPMRMGMALQLFWVRADINGGPLDPLALSRLPAPPEGAYALGSMPASQVQAVVDASKNEVTQRVHEYAKLHEGQDSPFGWQLYLQDSEAFMRFVCHEMVVNLMDQELQRITVRMPAQ